MPEWLWSSTMWITSSMGDQRSMISLLKTVLSMCLSCYIPNRNSTMKKKSKSSASLTTMQTTWIDQQITNILIKIILIFYISGLLSAPISNSYRTTFWPWLGQYNLLLSLPYHLKIIEVYKESHTMIYHGNAFWCRELSCLISNHKSIQSHKNAYSDSSPLAQPVALV